MNPIFLKTTIVNTEIFTLSMTAKDITSILKTTLNDEGLFNSKEIEINKRKVTQDLMINPVIFLNLKTKEQRNVEDLIQKLSNCELDTSEVNIEVVFGVDSLKTLETFGEEGLIVNVTVDLSDEKKLELFTLFNKDSGNRSLFNKKRALNLLEEEEAVLFETLVELHTADNSPLNGRICLDDGSLLYGLSPETVTKILASCSLFKKRRITDAKIFAKLVINMLIAYEISFKGVYGSKKQAIIKACDLRYIIFLLPYMYKYAESYREKLTVDNFVKMLEIIKKENKDLSMDYFASLKGESSIKGLAKKHGLSLLAHAEIYDPSEGI